MSFKWPAEREAWLPERDPPKPRLRIILITACGCRQEIWTTRRPEPVIEVALRRRAPFRPLTEDEVRFEELALNPRRRFEFVCNRGLFDLEYHEVL